MRTYQVELLGCTPVADGTMEFQFSRPQDFVFAAGQAVDLVIDDEGQAQQVRDVRHAFSLVGTPAEQILRIATRVRESNYKQKLLGLPIGSLLHIEEPFGNLPLDADQQRAAVMLAGGIGITPFMSIVRDAVQQGSQRQMVLFYASRSVGEAAYLQQLQQLDQSCNNFRLVASMTGAQAAEHWDGETGYFTAQMLEKYCHGLERPIYYVSGPPALVELVYDMLEESGIDDDDIRVEGFSGYE